MHASFVLKDRSNRELLAGVKNLVGQECNTTAYLIAHLSEIELRGLHLEEGCPSLFKYCTEILHLSESAAYRRIDVARIAREYPVILEMLAEGSVNLTTVLLLGPCLTPENHQALLEAARHQSKEVVERLVVALRPRPDVPAVIRKLPDLQEPIGEVVATPVRSIPSRKPVVSPLSPERYKIQFTASAETCRKLRQLQELLRHQVPTGDLAAIIDRGLTILLEQVTREKLAQVKRPRKAASTVRAERRVGSDAVVSLDPGSQARSASRHIPAEVKRHVWKREGAMCVREQDRAPMFGKGSARVSSCGTVRVGWLGYVGEHRAPMPRAQRSRGRVGVWDTRSERKRQRGRGAPGASRKWSKSE